MRARRQPDAIHGALLALIPLAQLGLIDPSREVIIDAASGVTGAGRNPNASSSSAKSPRTIARTRSATRIAISRAEAVVVAEGGFTGDLVFTPHLLP